MAICAQGGQVLWKFRVKTHVSSVMDLQFCIFGADITDAATPT
jgi:hypothetical protein